MFLAPEGMTTDCALVYDGPCAFGVICRRREGGYAVVQFGFECGDKVGTHLPLAFDHHGDLSCIEGRVGRHVLTETGPECLQILHAILVVELLLPGHGIDHCLAVGGEFRAVIAVPETSEVAGIEIAVTPVESRE